MSYIGNPIVSTDFPKDTFSGNGSTTAFTMSIAPASVNSVLVVVSGVTQDPSTYTISGTTLTFSAAPPTGTSNISVRHLGIAGIPNTPSTGSVVPASINSSYSLWNLSGSDVNYTAGKVGVGTTSPYNLLTLQGNAATSFQTAPVVSFYETSGNAASRNWAMGCAIGTGNYGQLNFMVGSSAGSAPTTTNVMALDSSGKVGIGTSSPGRALEIYSSGPAIKLNNGTYNWTVGTGGFIDGTDSLVFYSGTAGDGVGRFTGAGNFLVGTTSASTPSGNTSKFVVQGSFGAGAGAYGASISSTTTGINQYYISFQTGTTTERGYIWYNNGAGQVQLSATSDERLKENIVTAPSALPILDQVKVRQYDWKETGNTNIGFIAQELHNVIPTAVSVGEDNEDGSIKRTWGVDNATLVPYLVKAIQELNAKVDAQAVEIQALKGTA